MRKREEGTDAEIASGQITQAFKEHEIEAVGIAADEYIQVFTLMQNMIAAILPYFIPLTFVSR